MREPTTKGGAWRRLAAAILRRAALDAENNTARYGFEARNWLMFSSVSACLCGELGLSRGRVLRWVLSLNPLPLECVPSGRPGPEREQMCGDPPHADVVTGGAGADVEPVTIGPVVTRPVAGGGDPVARRGELSPSPDRGGPPPDSWIFEELAECIQVDVDDIARMVETGELEAIKQGGQIYVARTPEACRFLYERWRVAMGLDVHASQ